MSASSGRRGFSWPVLLLVVVLIGIPIVEVYLLVMVGRAIGTLPTIAILVAEAIFGAWLMRREGSRAWAALTGALGQGTMPSRQLADAALVLTGGLLLTLPGFFTDLIGVVCLVPFTRPLARSVIAWFAARQAARHGIDLRAPRVSRGGNVVEGEVVDDPGPQQFSEPNPVIEGRVVE